MGTGEMKLRFILLFLETEKVILIERTGSVLISVRASANFREGFFVLTNRENP